MELSSLIMFIGIGFGLAMDSFTVSITGGAYIRNLRFRDAVKIAFLFGLFQALMPMIGWAAGLTFYVYIHSFDHWIAFGLLVFIGARMVIDFLRGKEINEQKNILYFPTAFVLAIATSIDALAVGMSFAMIDILIIKPVLIIGMVTFLLCVAGVYIGNRFGQLFGRWLELAGGVVLIGIGIRILIEHLTDHM